MDPGFLNSYSECMFSHKDYCRYYTKNDPKGIEYYNKIFRFRPLENPKEKIRPIFACYVMRLIDESILSRFLSLYAGTVYALHGSSLRLLLGTVDLIGGFVSADLDQIIHHAGRHYLIALIYITALPLLGILGFFHPTTAWKVAGKIERYLKTGSTAEGNPVSLKGEKSDPNVIWLDLNTKQKKYDVVSGQILSPFAGILFTTAEVVNGIGFIFEAPLTENEGGAYAGWMTLRGSIWHIKDGVLGMAFEQYRLNLDIDTTP